MKIINQEIKIYCEERGNGNLYYFGAVEETKKFLWFTFKVKFYCEYEVRYSNILEKTFAIWKFTNKKQYAYKFKSYEEAHHRVSEMIDENVKEALAKQIISYQEVNE